MKETFTVPHSPPHTRDPRVADVLPRVMGEYIEMPGLCLTEAQAQRLWALEAPLCTALLAALVDARFLVRTRAGAYVRVEGSSSARS